VLYGGTVTVTTDIAVDTVTLLPLGSVTHGFNHNQRIVRPSFTGGGTTNLTVTMPMNPNVAPPGVYMLFVLSGGVPSHAEMIRISSGDYDSNPVVNIDTVIDLSSFNGGDPITFTVRANDAEDGDLRSSVSWNSNIDGPFGTGSPLTISTLLPGTHTITASVNDLTGNSGNDSISITVNSSTLRVVDNTDATGINFFSAVGSWPLSTSIPGFFGTDYQYAAAGDGSKTATWTFEINQAGQYEVEARWTASGNRAPDAPYTILNNGNVLGVVPVDQRVNGGGQFNSLGTFDLDAGTLEVVLTNAASRYVIADAVQVSFVSTTGGNIAPNGVIDTPGGDHTIVLGTSVDFTGTASDPDSTPPGVTYLWRFGAGSGIPDATVEDPGLKQFDTVGVFQVTFTVTDGEGQADPTPATVTITVNSRTVS